MPLPCSGDKILLGTTFFFRGQEIHLESTGDPEKDECNIRLFVALLYNQVKEVHELFSVDERTDKVLFQLLRDYERKNGDS